MTKLIAALVAYVAAMICAVAALVICLGVLNDIVTTDLSASYSLSIRTVWYVVVLYGASKLLAEIGRRWTEDAETDG